MNARTRVLIVAAVVLLAGAIGFYQMNGTASNMIADRQAAFQPDFFTLQESMRLKTGAYELTPMIRAQFLLVVSQRSIDKLSAAENKFAELFPDGFTKSTFPASLVDKTTFQGAWKNPDSGAVSRDNVELIFVDIDPRQDRNYMEKVVTYKNYIEESFGESECWTIIAPTFRVSTP